MTSFPRIRQSQLGISLYPISVDKGRENTQGNMVMRYPDTDSDLSDDSLDDDDSSSPTYPPDIYYNPQDSSAFGSARYSRPLIDYVKNEWQTNPNYRHDQPSSENEMPQWARLILLTMAAPKVRRYVPLGLIFLLFFWCFWKMFVMPQLEENALLADSLDPELKDMVGGWFGSNSLPKFGDLIKIGALNSALLPADLAMSGSQRKRLVFVGDVHGCKSECILFPLYFCLEQPISDIILPSK